MNDEQLTHLIEYLGMHAIKNQLEYWMKDFYEWNITYDEFEKFADYWRKQKGSKFMPSDVYAYVLNFRKTHAKHETKINVPMDVRESRWTNFLYTAEMELGRESIFIKALRKQGLLPAFQIVDYVPKDVFIEPEELPNYTCAKCQDEGYVFNDKTDTAYRCDCNRDKSAINLKSFTEFSAENKKEIYRKDVHG